MIVYNCTKCLDKGKIVYGPETVAGTKEIDCSCKAKAWAKEKIMPLVLRQEVLAAMSMR